jgi:hypothetical protein
MILPRDGAPPQVVETLMVDETWGIERVSPRDSAYSKRVAPPGSLEETGMTGSSSAIATTRPDSPAIPFLLLS